jgi:hypothetical protein
LLLTEPTSMLRSDFKLSHRLRPCFGPSNALDGTPDRVERSY